MAVQNGRHALNDDYLKSTWSESEHDIEMIIMATTTEVDGEW